MLSGTYQNLHTLISTYVPTINCQHFSLSEGFFWLHGYFITCGTNWSTFFPEVALTKDWWELIYKHPSPPRSGGITEAHVLYWVPDFSSRIQFHLPLIITCLQVNPELAVFSVLLPIPLVLIPTMTSQNNYLHLNPCLKVCFSGNQTKRQIDTDDVDIDKVLDLHNSLSPLSSGCWSSILICISKIIHCIH